MRAISARHFGRERDHRRVSDHETYVQSRVGLHLRRHERGSHADNRPTSDRAECVRIGSSIKRNFHEPATRTTELVVRRTTELRLCLIKPILRRQIMFLRQSPERRLCLKNPFRINNKSFVSKTNPAVRGYCRHLTRFHLRRARERVTRVKYLKSKNAALNCIKFQ